MYADIFTIFTGILSDSVTFLASKLFIILIIWLAVAVLLTVSHNPKYALREKSRNTELFVVCVFPHSDWIWNGEVLSISPYSVRMRLNMDQKKTCVWTLTAVLHNCLRITFQKSYFSKLLWGVEKYLTIIARFCLFLGAVHMRWAGPATWAGSTRWGDFHPEFIWKFLSHWKSLLCHCKKIVLITWLLSGKFYIFNMDFRRLQQFHFTVYSIMNMITAFSILLQLHGILLILVLLILDFTYLVVLVVAILKSNLERIPKHKHTL